MDGEGRLGMGKRTGGRKAITAAEMLPRCLWKPRGVYTGVQAVLGVPQRVLLQ